MIDDDFQLKMLLQFLIIRLNSHNGQPDSIKVMQNINLFDPNKSVMDMVEQIYAGYLIMKVRMKISYEAARSNRTIQQLLFDAILDAYKERNAKNLVRNPYPPIKSSHLQALKNASIKNLTERGLIDEARIIECSRLKGIGNKCDSRNVDGHQA